MQGHGRQQQPQGKASQEHQRLHHQGAGHQDFSAGQTGPEQAGSTAQQADHQKAEGPAQAALQTHQRESEQEQQMIRTEYGVRQAAQHTVEGGGLQLAEVRNVVGLGGSPQQQRSHQGRGHKGCAA